MTKTIMILIIAAAFVAGTITTGSMAFAQIDLCSQPSADSKKSVWHGLCDLQEQIDIIELTPGPAGPQGDPGVLNFNHRFGPIVTVQPGAFVALTASCLSGDQLTGGGHQVTIGIGAPQIRISAPLTSSPSDTWEVQLFNPNAVATQNVRAVVICADFP